MSLIARTRDVIEKYGFCQGTFGSEYSGYCILGAMRRVVYDYREINLAMNVLTRKLGGSVVVWNDMPGRTKTDVLELLGSCSDE